MKWSNWYVIADKNFFYTGKLTYNGPAVYQLGICGPYGQIVKPVYIGETCNEKKRIHAYARHGSHISDIIYSHLRNGWILYYRAIAMATKADAKRIQDTILYKNEFDWNIVNN